MRDKKFFEITWPGTHNSNSNNREGGTEKKYNYDYTARNMIQDIYKVDIVARLKAINSAINTVNKQISNLRKIDINLKKIDTLPTDSFNSDVSTLNQELSVEEQLNNGIRFLSLDLLKRENNNTVYFSHGSTDLGRSQLRPLLGSIRNFLQERHGQILIVGFDMLVDKRLSIENDLNVLAKAPNVFKNAAQNLTEFKFEKAYKTIKNMIFQVKNALNHIQSELDEMKVNTDPSNTEKYEVMKQFYQACKQVGLWKFVEQGDALNPEINKSIFAMQSAFDDNAWRSLREMQKSNKRLIFLMDFINTKYPSTTNNYKHQINGKKQKVSKHWTDYDPSIAVINPPAKAGKPLSSFTLYANPNPGNYGSGDRDAVKPLNEAMTLFLSGQNVVNKLSTMQPKPYFTYYQVHFFEPGYNQPNPQRSGLTVVDAANRINFEKFGYKWTKRKAGNFYWNAQSTHLENLQKIHGISNAEPVEVEAKELSSGSTTRTAPMINHSPYDYYMKIINSPDQFIPIDVIEFKVKNGQQIKLKAIAAIGFLEKSTSGVPQSIIIKGSNDGKKWNKIFKGIGGKGPLWKYLKINSTQGYRYFRIAMTGNQSLRKFHAFHLFK